MSNSRKQRFLALASLSWCEHAHATPHADEAASQLASSPSLSLSWPRPIRIKPGLSQTILTLGDEAHSGSYHGSCSLYTHACFTHRHRRHALPLHTCSSTTPPKHSPAQSSREPPFGSRGSPTATASLGSSQCVSGTATTALRRQAFEIHLVNLLWPQPPLA